MYPLRDLSRRAGLIMKMYQRKAAEEKLFDTHFLKDMELMPSSHYLVTDSSKQLLFSRLA